MAALQLTNYDFHVRENKSAHNCGAYIGNDLVVRRAQEFRISMSFNAPVRDGDRLQFTAALATSSGGNSLLEYTFSDSSVAWGNSWAAQRRGTGSSDITMIFNTPSDAVIGRYVLIMLTNGGMRRIGEFWLIFNPWAAGDSVYLADQAEREEYVLQEFGIIAGGEYSNRSEIPWNYGQFQQDVLYTTFVLLDSTVSFRRNPQEDVRQRNNPTHICRVLSAIANSKDDNGVVQGSWSGDYSDGTNPTAWLGSYNILKAWNQQRAPVKYGQCWVFAGVLCTVNRTLGIPCRVITNYNSAHDTNGNMTIEEYYDIQGNAVAESDDSIWNFHCWNEAWFVRTDLDPKYNGWQIIDTTPQEMSDGMYQLGPASQIAVKEGDVDKPYDTRFVFSEVNADIIEMIIQPNRRTTRGQTNSTKVGIYICTKAVGQNFCTNITSEYKDPEGSSEERQTYNKALRLSGMGTGFVAFSADGNRTSAPSRAAEVSGDISVSGSPMIGDDIEAILTLKNLTPKSKNVTVNITAAAVVYNKAVRRKIFTESVKVNLGSNEENEIPIKITYSQYEKVLTTDNAINVTAVCQIQDSGDLVVQSNFVLKKPPLKTKALGPSVVGKPVTVQVEFTNPLPTPIRDCVLTAEGCGLTQNEVKKSIGVLEPAETMNVTLDIEPSVPGDKKLVVNFSSDKFIDVKDFLSMHVIEDS
ncbi:protein-glutamine gamma-glutamyltransferase E-like isoform X2 [Eleutherodactylus coqui]|uniref:protein-glutamine gamma-glutamyltransferase E-like isoform X2 n=1 Tax=Eleutherodactylus coqui TaxID=57060 RepID=UPI003461E939